MIEILILGIIAVYGVSVVVCVLLLVCTVDKDKTTVVEFVKGLINSLIPILNTIIILNSLFNNNLEED